MNRRALISLVAVSAVLGGCSTFKKLTGQRNDTVLPGQREEILTPDQYRSKSEDLQPQGNNATTAPAPAPPADSQVPAQQDNVDCDPEADPSCVPPSNGVNKGIFNDG